MKLIKLLIALVVIFSVALNSCTKEAKTVVTSDAVIRATDPAQGCGYVIVIETNDQTYAPKNLTAEFTPVDTLNVRVTYRLLNTVRNCTKVAGGYQEVELTSISKR